MEVLHVKTIDKTTQWHEDILHGCDFMDIYDHFEVHLMSCEVIFNAASIIFLKILGYFLQNMGSLR